MSVNRRDFFKISAITAGTLLGGAKSVAAKTSAKSYDDAYAMLNDCTKCIGCRLCETSCQQNKNLAGLSNQPARELDARHLTLIKLYKAEREMTFLKRQCMHCNDPACVSACPVSALQKLANGVVTYDKGKCIGCRYCMIACPFDVPAFEYHKAFPVIRKCDFCIDELEKGRDTICARVCPTGAIKFGRRGDLIAEARERIKSQPHRYVNHIYGEKELAGTSVLYLTGVPFEKLGFQTFDSVPPHQAAETIQHGIFKYFIPPLALYGALGIYGLMTRKKGKTPESVPEEE